MNDQFEEFLKFLDALDRNNVEYILIGGVAINIHGLDRLTRDVDIIVKLTPENIDLLRKALYSMYDDDSIEEITERELVSYPVIRYGTPHGFYIDIVNKLGDVFSFDNLDYEIINFKGIKIRVATPETLLNMKSDTVREKDKIDASFLKELILNKKKS
ncbi:hypothetical protein JW960_22380 [candidate division KSB1 bacterium]|nr:hypothetical protein [candidate division KSB1 bacterium]